MNTENPGIDENPADDAAALPAPIQDDSVPAKKSRSLGMKILIAVAGVAVFVGAWFGVQALFNVFNGVVGAASEVPGGPADPGSGLPDDPSDPVSSGVEYTSDTYTVVFPGEPETSTVDSPVGAAPLEVAGWQNGQMAHQVVYLPTRLEGLTLESSVEGALQNSGATLVSKTKVAVAGGTALLAEGTVQGQKMWVMTVFANDSEEQFILVQVGGEHDDTFFGSFTIR